MTPEQASAIKDFLVSQYEYDSSATARVLEAVPDANSSYKPDEKGMSALDLVHHITAVEVYFLSSVVEGGCGTLDDSAIKALQSPAEVAKLYRERVPALLEQIKSLSGEHMTKVTRFAVWDLPLVKVLQFGLLHTVHHRGQLSAMIRPMGGKVPSIYGGSADEPFQTAAAAKE